MKRITIAILAAAFAVSAFAWTPSGPISKNPGPVTYCPPSGVCPPPPLCRAIGICPQSK